MNIKKTQIIFALFLLCGFIFPKTSDAHGSGFPPFFKVNNVIAAPYFLQNVGVYSTNITVPQDATDKNFLVGETIDFAIDESQLGTVYPPEVMSKIKYKWDFGDSTQADGTKNSHVYKKMGSYILKITADYQDPNTPPQLIESLLINVFSDKNYQLPKSIINVNGKQGNSKNYNILDFDLANSLAFDGSNSFSKSSNITKYTWDFGDDKMATGANVSHQYELPQAFATAVLRVTDKNGFFSDSYVNVRNNGKNDQSNSSSGFKLDPRAILPLATILFIIILASIVIIFKKR